MVKDAEKHMLGYQAGTKECVESEPLGYGRILSNCEHELMDLLYLNLPMMSWVWFGMRQCVRHAFRAGG